MTFTVFCDPNNAPPRTHLQEFNQFIKNGGNASDFALLSGADSQRQLMVTVATNAMGVFRTYGIPTGSNTEQERDEIRRKIAYTLAVIARKTESNKFDTDEDLGINYIGNGTYPNLSTPA